MSALSRLLAGEAPDADDVVALLELDDAAFVDVVVEAVQTRDEEDWFALLARPVRARTGKAMTRIRQAGDRHVNASTGAYREAALATHKQQCHEINRRVHQAEHLRRTEHDALMADQKRRSRAALMRLAVAIQRHRLASAAAGLEPEPHDTALWEVLGSTSTPGENGDVLLSDLLATGTWAAEIAADGGAS